MGPLTTPKKVGDSRSMDVCDPWTPTSNLKILISAASPDIRNREKELCKDSDVQDSADVGQVCVFIIFVEIIKIIYMIKLKYFIYEVILAALHIEKTSLRAYLFVCVEQDVENGEESERGMSRKEKSLGLLCHRFLARFPDCPETAATANDICLDDMATELSMPPSHVLLPVIKFSDHWEN